MARSLRWFLLVFQAFFLNVVIPAHTRGSVQLPGAPAPSKWLAPCCQREATKSDRPGGQPTPQQQSNCAICFFAAHLSLPPVVDYRPAALGLLDVLPFPSPACALAIHLCPLPPSRGPPVEVA